MKELNLQLHTEIKDSDNLEIRKELAAQKYALDRLGEVENIGYLESAFIAGFETAYPKWIKVEDQKPEYHKQVLLKYLKGKREVITQGYFCDYAQDIAYTHFIASEARGKFSENGVETVDFWRKCGRGETYFDYAERQIQALNAKTSKNKVISWMEIPQ